MNTETAAPPPAIVNGHQLASYDDRSGSLPMPVQVERIIARVEAVREIIARVFKEDVHFGKIPGTGDKKTLLKPGFDMLCLAFQFSPDFVKQPESIETSEFINLVYKCVLTSASGHVVATGIGSCNSKEEKYRWINSARKCPACGKEAISKSKEEWGGGWYCSDKKGGCAAKFKKGDRAIEDQEAGRKENDNAWNNHNTLTKMSQKRSGMAAVITACGLSSDFTQDMEDFEPQNDKSKRDEPMVDIQASHGPDRPFYQEEERRMEDFGGADVHPWPGSEQPTDAQWKPAPTEPAFPADILKARESVLKELAHCKDKQDFQRLKAHMQASGAAFLDARVTSLVNEAYAKTFPAKPKGA